MQRYIIGRIIQAAITVLFVSAVIFGLTRLTGNPLDVIMPEEATQEEYDFMAQKMGLDKPLAVQYWIFLKGALHGDFGKSIRFRRPAAEVVIERLPATLKLGALAFFAALIIAIPIGVYTARYKGTWLDFSMRGFAVLGQSLPHFWTGIILILIFAVWLGWLPTSGMGGPETYVLPTITLGYLIVAGIMRLTRSSTLDVLETEYVKLARSKGVHEQIVIWKHAFIKNATLPVLTAAAVTFVRILTGSIVTETVFAWPGIGRLVVEAVHYRDFAVVQTIVLLVATMYIFANLIVDILYGFLNPKIRY